MVRLKYYQILTTSMSTVKLSSKGQLVIPKNMRDKLGLKPGDAVKLELVGDKKVVIQAGMEPPSDIFAKAGSKIVEEALLGSRARDEEKVIRLLRALGVES